MKLEFNGNGSAEVIEKGAELRSLKLLTGRELMWQAGEQWAKTSPVLFPMVGGVRFGKTLIGTEEYALPKHGFARDYNFSSSKIASNSASFTFTHNNETLAVYPFKFTFKLSYQLNLGRLKIIYTVCNDGDTDMPFAIGAHPAFNVPFDKKGDFSKYKLVFSEREDVDCPLFDLTEMAFDPEKNNGRGIHDFNEYHLAYENFVNDCVYFPKLKSKEVLLTADGKTGVKLSWEGFEGLGVWTPADVNAPFVCLEPWCSSADFLDDSGVFAEKRGIQTAKPGETLKYTLTIEEVA
ncbi:LACX protein [Clostridia bacterium]|nr:LACX protein [Clostridia bacterium]